MEIENLYITVGDETYINIPSLYTLNADVYIVLVNAQREKRIQFSRDYLTNMRKQGRNLFTCVHAKIILSVVERGGCCKYQTICRKTLWKEEANLNYYSGIYRKQELGRNNKWVYSPCGYSSSIASWMKYKGNGYDAVKTIFLTNLSRTTTLLQ